MEKAVPSPLGRRHPRGIGINERDTEASGGSLFNTLIYRRVRHRLQIPQIRRSSHENATYGRNPT